MVVSGSGEPRPVKVIAIGAGFSGLCTAIQFPRKIKNLSLTIYEKNLEFGGTWYENRQVTSPASGLQCMAPRWTHTTDQSYQFTFENYTQWPEFYSAGQDILAYIKRVAEKYHMDRYLKLQHEVIGANWSDASAKWTLHAKDLATGKVFSDDCDFLVVNTGILNAWSWPDIPGLKDFKGRLSHTADWDESYDVEGKEVVVIGGGSSAIRVIPAIQPKVKKLDSYMRSKTWIASGGFAAAEALKRDPEGLNSKYGEEELANFAKNPEEFAKYHKYVEHQLNTVHTVGFAGSEASQQSIEILTKSMKEKLAKKPEIIESLIPDFPPVCRRLTPGIRYLEALVEDNVNFIPTPIKRIVADGIETVDGKVRKVDTIIVIPLSPPPLPVPFK
ncbi:flavin-bindingprotein [Ophiostoma piceae UAMH 11346]|uniref:Flavin-bindingprotein n=1 Tax=Ophiostoma piceae (strain UAMH 11346) TaxID=1262450 RepID=S3BPU9_OPHP1|nr:flavin-bindingprotein [Ophiostoma piceae UAMH 11346]